MRTPSAARRFIERAALAACGLALAAAWVGAYEDGAPPGHSGAPGEADCTACHSDNPKNDAAGALVLEGLPERYAPGARYALTVVLTHPELEAGGFQLTARAPDGAVPGRLLSVDARTRRLEADGRQYLQHTPESRRAEEEGRIAWQLEWRAPATATPVVLYLAANAANDDLSELGDFIYTLERRLEPAD
jgi:hypothetical protein